MPLAGCRPETSIGARWLGRACSRSGCRCSAHVTEYAVLGALLYRAFEREAPALAAGIAYAATDEVHQHFVRGRHGAPVDVAVDAVGVALGMLVWLRLRQR